MQKCLNVTEKKDPIEKIFHSLKNEIEIKPLRVWTEKSIRGAILIGFLAQLFVSLVRYEVPESTGGLTQRGSLSKARRSLAPHVATKFIKY